MEKQLSPTEHNSLENRNKQQTNLVIEKQQYWLQVASKFVISMLNNDITCIVNI